MLYFFAGSSLLACIVSLITADRVYHCNKKLRVNRAFAFSNLVMSLNFFAEFMYRQSTSLEMANFWGKINLLMLAAILFFLRFSLIFTEHEALLKNKFLIALMCLPFLFFDVMALTTDLVSGTPVRNEWGILTTQIPQNRLFYDLFNIWLIFIGFMIFALFVRYFFKMKNLVKKAQVRYAVIGIVPILVVFILDALLAKVQNFSPAVLTLSAAWFNVCIGYAMWRYELFTLDTPAAAYNIVSTLPDSLLLINAYDTIMVGNPSFLALTKYSEAEIVGASFRNLFPDQTTADEIKQELIRVQAIANKEIAILNKAGEEISMLLSGSLMRDKHNSMNGFILILRDIRERKQFEESSTLPA